MMYDHDVPPHLRSHAPVIMHIARLAAEGRLPDDDRRLWEGRIGMRLPVPGAGTAPMQQRAAEPAAPPTPADILGATKDALLSACRALVRAQTPLMRLQRREDTAS